MFTGERSIFSASVGEVSSSQQMPLGTLAITKDGRKFRYAKGGAADIVSHNLLIAPDAVAAHLNCAIAAAVPVGAKSITITLGATLATANQYKDGYVYVNDGVGEGQLLQIAGHPAAAQGANLKVSLVNPVEVAFTVAGSEVSLQLNPWNGVVISNTDQADLPIGVAHVAVDVSEAPYFWVQTGGVATCWADEAFAKGAALTIGTGVAGQVEMLDAAGEAQIGTALETAVDTEFRTVFLTID